MPDPGRRQAGVMIAVAAATVLIAIVLPVLTWLAGLWTDALWFAELGHGGVFWTILATKAVAALAFGAVAGALLYANVRVARAMAPKAAPVLVDEAEPPYAAALRAARAALDPWIDRAAVLLAVVVGFAFGLPMASEWERFRLALSAVPFGAADPQFGRDIGFFVFTLPALRVVSDWMMSAFVITLVVTVLVHLYDGAIRPAERLRGFAPHVKGHVSLLLGLIVASKAFDYWLRIYELSFSPRGQVTGASYTDVHAQLPAYRILIVIAGLTALALVANVTLKGWRLPIVALGVWIGAGILVGGLYPALVQQLRVSPNEAAAEAPYIVRNIASTREAFGLTDIETRQFAAAEDLTAADVTANRTTLSNVRLWDPNIVVQSYRQLQAIRAYYDFGDMDVDRYDIGGKRRQVLVSAREMNVEHLAEQAKTWVNQHLVYTHGYGLVMSPVNEATSRGYPDFVLRDIPPKSSEASLAVKRPEIYFGEGEGNYVVVGTGLEEFDYPVGDKNATTHYAGKAGIAVGGFFRRAAFAMRLGSWQMLFSSYITPESRVLYARSLTDRIGRLAPWLWLDSDPYPVLAGGRIVWVVDGYTWSDSYPNAEPYTHAPEVTYVRNSVKVTVDAYDGTVTLYAVGEDPVRDAWAKAFPGLITPGEQMPAEIRAHLRYPEDLFKIQAEMYKNYHMTDPGLFYNKEDSWALPGENTDTPAEPYYVLMGLPGDAAEDFMMMMPFTPRVRDNMIGWMAARSDPSNYGERVVLQFPKQKTVLGPKQVSAQINQDPVVSPQITLWSQAGSKAIFGNMLVIPLEDSVVFVQPLYLQAEQSAIPELTRVIVVYGDTVAMEETLEKALLKVFGAEEQAGGSAGATGTVEPAADAAAAAALYKKAVESQKAGDWAAYGKHLEDLGRVLDRMVKASQAATATR